MKKLMTLIFFLGLTPAYSTLYTSQDFKDELVDGFGSRLNEEIEVTQSSETGLAEKTLYQQDLDSFKIGLHVNSDPMTVGHIISLDLEYNAHWYENKFVNYFFYSGLHRFDAVSSPNADLAGNGQLVTTEANNLTSVGMGISLVTHYLGPLLGINNLEESVSSNFGFAFMGESFRNETYSGPGVKADFGLNIRPAEDYYYGLEFSWNHYAVTRDVRFDGEDVANRHLSLTWASIGVNWGFYF